MVAYVGWGLKAEIQPAAQIITKDLTIRGSWYFNIADYQNMLSFIESQKIPLLETVTHRFALDDVSRAFELFDAKNTLKTVLIPG